MKCLGIVVAIVLCTCTEVTDPPGPLSEVIALTGHEQAFTAGEAAAQPIVLRVVDASGRGIPGVPVRLNIRLITGSGSSGSVITAPGGAVTPSVTTTDTRGDVRAFVTMGEIAGDYALYAETDNPRVRTGVRLRALPAAPRRIAFATDTLTLTIGSHAPISAHVADRFNNPHTTPVQFRNLDTAVLELIPPDSAAALEAGTARVVASALGFVDTLVVIVPLPARFDTLTLGEKHSCGLLAQTVSCWGGGNAAPPPRIFSCEASLDSCNPHPTLVPGAPQFVVIDAGASYSCGLAGESPYCWGSGDLPMGNGATTTDRPLAVSTQLRFEQISAGYAHVCALTVSGEAYCWGFNRQGALGSGNVAASSVPVAVTGELRFQKIFAGYERTCGITTTGDSYCWGANTDGQLGTGLRTETQPSGEVVPQRVTASEPLLKIYADHPTATCALGTSGRVYCWGALPSVPEWRVTPTPSVIMSAIFRDLALGQQQVCALEAIGSVRCWGISAQGENLEAVLLSTSARFTQLFGGSYHFCGLTVEREAYCWGRNSSGQLGNGLRATSVNPVAVLR